MKYLVMRKQKRSMDEEINEFNTLEEAIKFSDSEFNYLCESDRKNCEYFFILESVNPDENAEDHYDGNFAKVYKN